MKDKLFSLAFCLAAAMVASPAVAQSCGAGNIIDLAGIADIIARNGASTPVGGTIYTRPTDNQLVVCWPNPGSEQPVRYLPEVHSGYRYLGNYLYDSGVGGVAIRFTAIRNQWGEMSRLPTSDLLYGVWAYWSPPTDNWFITRTVAQISFIKTGPITGGTLSGDLLIMRLTNGSPVVTYRFTGSQTVAPQVPTCRVTANGNQAVRLGSVNTSAFSGVGSTSPQVSFPVRLDCAGGAPGSTVAVHAVLTDATNAANRSDRLTLASGSGATGVALQVLKDGNALSYGPDSSAAGTENQWPIATLGNQEHTFNLAARYVQTATTITPGSANGMATITLSYQ